MEELWKSAEKECPDPIQADVSGTIPSWLKGNLYRNGPGKFEVGETKFNHWFDGMALLHRFHINEGKVEYRSKFLESDTYKRNMKANRIIVGEFGTAPFPDPCKNIFRRFFSHFTKPEATDNCLVNMYPIGESLYAATETKYLRKIDPETLDTLDKVDLNALVSVNGATAHPHIDADGCVHNMGAVNKKGYQYAIIRMTPSKGNLDKVVENAEVVTTIQPANKLKPSYYHSFGMTENYYIFIESPLHINILKVLKNHILGKALSSSIEWYSDKSAQIHVLDKKTGKIVNNSHGYYMKAFFAFHQINAFEENGHIVMDLPCLDDGSLITKLNLEELQSEGGEDLFAALPKPQPRRIVIPLDLESQKEGNLVTLEGTTASAKLTGPGQVTLQYETLTPIEFDFAQINYKKYNTKKHRFVYGVGYKITALDSLVKLDVETRETNVWYKEGHYPSEPVFVESPDPTSEDDGLVLSVVLTTGENRHAYLLVLDAKSWEEKARAVVNVKIGLGTHSYYR